jgi:hypothetical protein
VKAFDDVDNSGLEIHGWLFQAGKFRALYFSGLKWAVQVPGKYP